MGDGGRVQAGPFASPAYPGGDHARQGVAVGVVEDDLGRHPVEQESCDLGRADPQRLAGVVVGSEVHQQPGTVLGRLLGQAGCVRGGEKLGDDGVTFTIVDLGHGLRRAVRLGHGPAASQSERPELPQLVTDLRLPSSVGRGEPVLQQPPGLGRVDLVEHGERFGQRRLAQLTEHPGRFRGHEEVLDPTAEMVEVHQRNQAVLARSVAEHRQQARLIAKHIRQPPTGANLYLTDRGRPWRVRHAGRRQRRRRAGCGLTLCRGDPEDRQRP